MTFHKKKHPNHVTQTFAILTQSSHQHQHQPGSLIDSSVPNSGGSFSAGSYLDTSTAPLTHPLLNNNSAKESTNSGSSGNGSSKSYLYETSNHSEPSINFILANNKLKLNKKDPIVEFDLELAESIEFELGLKKQNGPRKNSWGNLSYAELITRAIESSLEQRLTLSQIYDWIVRYVPYFKEKYDRTSSAGWKVIFGTQTPIEFIFAV